MQSLNNSVPYSLPFDIALLPNLFVYSGRASIGLANPCTHLVAGPSFVQHFCPQTSNEFDILSLNTMASRSEDPETNYDQVNAWDESALRYPVTEVDQSGASDVAEFALVGVGVRFDNRGEPYPPEIDISEEDYTGQPCVRVQAGSSVSVSSRLGDTASPGSSPSTPGPNQAHLESGRPFIQPGDFEHIVRQRIRRSQRLRRRSSSKCHSLFFVL